MKEILVSQTGYPRFNQADLRYPLEQLTEADQVEKVLNFEYEGYKEDEREKMITKMIEKWAIPFLKDISTKKGIINSIRKYKDLKHRVKGRLTDALNGSH